MFVYLVRIRQLNSESCVECADRPVVVQYILKDSRDKGVYWYCEDCARELGMLDTVAGVAREAGLDARTIRKWCSSGYTNAYKNSDGRWLILTNPHSREFVVHGTAVR